MSDSVGASGSLSLPSNRDGGRKSLPHQDLILFLLMMVNGVAWHSAASRVLQSAVPSATVRSARERERTHSRYPILVKICVNCVFHFRAPAADASRFEWSSARVAGPVSPPPGAGPAATRGAGAFETNPLRK